MSVTLLDVNVLLALGLGQHEFHAAAVRWFDAQPQRTWASCPFTEAGFVRIASNLQRTPAAATVEQAVQVLREMKAASRHRFWPDEISLSDAPEFAALAGHQQITDAYLIALARHRKGKVATFDRAMEQLAANVFGDAGRVVLISP